MGESIDIIININSLVAIIYIGYWCVGGWFLTVIAVGQSVSIE